MSENLNYQTNIDDLKKQFSDYEKEKEQKSPAQKREEILQRIYIPRKQKEVFRILPPLKPGRKFYEVAYFHSIQTNSSGGNKKWTKIYCPKHNDPKVPKLDENGEPILQENGEPIMVPAPCPLCDKHNEILSTQDESIRYKKRDSLSEDEKLIFDKNKNIFMKAKQYEASKFYIVKGIDRWNMSDGPKFWRFKDSFTNRGTMDKLKTILEEYVERYGKDFMSPIDGTDLHVTMGDAKTPSGRPYKDISAITTRDPSPLYEEQHIAKSWLTNDLTWRDAFKPRKAPNITPYQYLDMLAKGVDPYYDEIDKKWIFPNNPELEKMANTRNKDLEGPKENFEQASDLDDNVTIDNIKKEDVGEFKNDFLDVTSEIKKDESKEKSEDDVVKTKKEESKESLDEDNLFDDDYDDLPF